ncbi:MAG: hypothetical protein PCFJNLEI_03945 [Verrucomicrobiae bacterium]|nr:hypothetical protein [Verrucomicrobiae bacterium]
MLPTMRLPLLKVPPPVMTTPLLDVLVRAPITTVPTLVRVPPLMRSRLLTALVKPTVRFCPPPFQTVSARRVTELFEAPLPMMLAPLAV